MEVESLTPEMRRAFESRMGVAHEEFLRRYSPYIESAFDTEALVKHIVQAEPETLAHLLATWFDNPRDSWLKGEVEESGVTDPDAGLIMMTTGERLSKQAMRTLPREMIEHLKDRLKLDSDEELAERLVEAHEHDVGTHEIAHLYHATALPDWFQEAGATWYGLEAMSEKYGFVVANDGSSPRIDAYNALLAEHGDRVHRVFFGSSSKEEVREITDVPIEV